MTETVTCFGQSGHKRRQYFAFATVNTMEQFPKWDEKGNLWEEAEYDRGILVAFTIKNGKPFDPTQVIDVSEDPDMVNILFGD
jgi:hypothetical protein